MGVTAGEWQRGPVIGRGASATVSIAADRSTGQVFAVKSVEMARAGILKREQSVLSALSSSPYVVSCLGSGMSADGSGACFDLFLEYAPGGSLADEIKRRGGRCEEAVIRARAADVLRGLAHAHGAGVAHCDVKGRNVLLGADGRAMLADFGCARWTNGAADEGNAAAVRGTPMFMAPEAARGEAQGAAADVWALGCTVIEMATGGAPWTPRFADPVATLHHVAHSGDVPETPAWLSDEGKDFLSRCLVRDPAARWTAEQLLQHPFVAAASSSAATDPSAAAKGGQRVSPKSILDQGFWEELETETESSSTDDPDATATLAPADRVRALAGGVSPDWTWTSGGEHWITVFAADIAAPPEPDASTPPKFDADTAELPEAEAGGSPPGASEEPHIGGSGEHMVSRGREDHGSRSSPPDGDDAGSSAGSRRGDSVVSSSNNECCSSGNSASASGNDNKGVINLRAPSWLVKLPVRAGSRFFTFQRSRFHALFFSSHLSSRQRPFRHVPGVSRNLEEEVVVVVTDGQLAAYDSPRVRRNGTFPWRSRWYRRYRVRELLEQLEHEPYQDLYKSH